MLVLSPDHVSPDGSFSIITGALSSLFQELFLSSLHAFATLLCCTIIVYLVKIIFVLWYVNKSMCTHYSVLLLLRADISFDRKFMIFLQNECNKPSEIWVALWVINDRKENTFTHISFRSQSYEKMKHFQCLRSTGGLFC